MGLRLTRQRLYIDDSEKASESALQLGVKSGNLSVVKELLAKGANAVHDEPETLHPLIQAAKQGSVEMVKELIDAGAPVDLDGKKRLSHSRAVAADASPIHAAITNGHLNVIQLLLYRGADVEKDVDRVGSPLTVAASKGKAEIVRLLLAAGVIAIDGEALSKAVEAGKVEIAQEMLAAGSKAAPVLAIACRQRRLRMLELLLEKVYDGEDAETVLDEAFDIQGLDDSVIRLLLDCAPPTMRRFVQVCAAGSVASVKFMLKKEGFDVNRQDGDNGDYPLQIQLRTCRQRSFSYFFHVELA